jgi:hypothetical protein
MNRRKPDTRNGTRTGGTTNTSPYRGGHNIPPAAPAGDATHIGSENRPGGGFDLDLYSGEYAGPPVDPSPKSQRPQRTDLSDYIMSAPYTHTRVRDAENAAHSRTE